MSNIRSHERWVLLCSSKATGEVGMYYGEVGTYEGEVGTYDGEVGPNGEVGTYGSDELGRGEGDTNDWDDDSPLRLMASPCDSFMSF